MQPYTSKPVPISLAASVSLLKSATVRLRVVYRAEQVQNYKRILTKPSQPVHNEGYDNVDYDYILQVNDMLQQYCIVDTLGSGTFGQVVLAQQGDRKVAVKVIKNKPAYFNQSMVEVTILQLLSKYQCKHIVSLHDSFIFRKHLCLVFEPLSLNLYELIKQNQFKGLSLSLVRIFTGQILEALLVLQEEKLIHCDLKPENVLLVDLENPVIKVIDFGSACHEQQTVYTYIQSRFYRSPEVLLGLQYSASIDIWSLGCIAAELFLGLPLFPGSSEYNQVSRIVDTCGLPPTYMMEFSKNGKHFFAKGPWRLKSIEVYNLERNKQEVPGKKYFATTVLDDLIKTYPLPKKIQEFTSEIQAEYWNRQQFVDFLKGLLRLNPLERFSAQQAKMHPFINLQQQTQQPSRQRTRSNTLTSARFGIPPQLQKIGDTAQSEAFPNVVVRDSPLLQKSRQNMFSSTEPLADLKEFEPAPKHTQPYEMHSTPGQQLSKQMSSMQISPTQFSKLTKKKTRSHSVSEQPRLFTQPLVQQTSSQRLASSSGSTSLMQIAEDSPVQDFNSTQSLSHQKKHIPRRSSLSLNQTSQQQPQEYRRAPSLSLTQPNSPLKESFPFKSKAQTSPIKSKKKS